MAQLTGATNMENVASYLLNVTRTGVTRRVETDRRR